MFCSCNYCQKSTSTKRELYRNYATMDKRTIGHVTTIVNSKNTDTFTNHKRNLEEKYYSKYDYTRLYTSNLSLLY